MSTDRDSDERLIDASPEFAAGYGAAMYDVWRRFPPPGLMREGLTESELIRLIAFVESCLPSPNNCFNLTLRPLIAPNGITNVH